MGEEGEGWKILVGEVGEEVGVERCCIACICGQTALGEDES